MLLSFKTPPTLCVRGYQEMADTPLKSGCFGLNDDALEVITTSPQF
nr:MAG TPA: hypothetical protein [Caudoviricetes sp.]